MDRIPKFQNQEGAIYSGHLMISNVNGYESDDEASSEATSESFVKALLPSPIQRVDVIDVNSVELNLNNTSYGKLNHFNLYSSNMTSKPFDDSLSRLFKCLSLAYNEKPTSPRWNWFKGLKMQIKDKLRLNNVIWRAWHMQFIFKIKPPVCQFEIGLDEKIPQIIILEGSYWKRRLDTVIAEYRKWRITMKDKNYPLREKRTFRLTHKLPNILKASHPFPGYSLIHQHTNCNQYLDLNQSLLSNQSGIGNLDFSAADNYSTSTTLIANDLLDLMETHNRTGEYGLDFKGHPGSPDYLDTLNEFLSFEDIDDITKSPGFLPLVDMTSNTVNYNYYNNTNSNSALAHPIQSPFLQPTTGNVDANSSICQLNPQESNLASSNTSSPYAATTGFLNVGIAPSSSSVKNVQSQATTSKRMKNEDKSPDKVTPLTTTDLFEDQQLCHHSMNLLSRSFIQPGLAKLRPNTGMSYMETVGPLEEIVKSAKRSYQHILADSGRNSSPTPQSRTWPVSYEDDDGLSGISSAITSPSPVITNTPFGISAAPLTDSGLNTPTVEQQQPCGTNSSYTRLSTPPENDPPPYQLGQYLQNVLNSVQFPSFNPAASAATTATQLNPSIIVINTPLVQQPLQTSSSCSNLYYDRNGNVILTSQNTDFSRCGGNQPILILNNNHNLQNVGFHQLVAPAMFESSAAATNNNNKASDTLNGSFSNTMFPHDNNNNYHDKNNLTCNAEKLLLHQYRKIAPAVSVHRASFSSNLLNSSPFNYTFAPAQTFNLTRTPTPTTTSITAAAGHLSRPSFITFAGSKSTIPPTVMNVTNRIIPINVKAMPTVLNPSCQIISTTALENDHKISNKNIFGKCTTSPIANFSSTRSNLSDDEIRYMDRKRFVHITCEHKRRCSIKNGFDALASLVPHLASQNPSKASKVAILSHTVEYTKHLRRKILETNHVMNEMKSQIAFLNQEISHYQSSLTAENNSITITISNNEHHNNNKSYNPNERVLRTKNIDVVDQRQGSFSISNTENLSETLKSLGLPALPSGVKPLLSIQDYIQMERAACFRDFTAYVHSKSSQSWKYRLFSCIFKHLFKSFNENITTTSMAQLCDGVTKWLESYFDLNQLRPVVSAILIDLSTKTSILTADPNTITEILKTYQYNSHS